MNTRRRVVGALCVSAIALGAAAGPALAFDCGNASKPVGPGEKAIVSGENVVWISKSWSEQLAHGKTVDQLHGGYLGFDVTGDGVADLDTYADPHGEIPEQAQVNGADCRGVTTIEQEAVCKGVPLP